MDKMTKVKNRINEFSSKIIKEICIGNNESEFKQFKDLLKNIDTFTQSPFGVNKFGMPIPAFCAKCPEDVRKHFEDCNCVNNVYRRMYSSKPSIVFEDPKPNKGSIWPDEEDEPINK